MIRDFTSTRLFLRPALSEGAVVDLDAKQANYLANVLRLRDNDTVLVFNGSDGEWRATLAASGKKTWRLTATEQTRPQPHAPDLQYIFAPLKHARLDYMVEKAVEMGAGRLRPVITRHTQVTRINRDRMEANAIEAAEQCGILTLPTIDEPIALGDLLDRWEKNDTGRRLIFCDESAAGDPLTQLASLKRDIANESPLPGGERDRVREVAPNPPPLAVLIGPEGGFAQDERAALLSRPYVTAISLGPRILRADTAAVAALALVQATLGDWRA
ncbi:MAG TPA: 16S rRNA (uracil(1498)-N(3))-methyltransferase [Bauldia sp.]|nr:16S rRNA (uracil(1498)-N(3))-methyltransferase [Bauldia sp.]